MCAFSERGPGATFVYTFLRGILCEAFEKSFKEYSPCADAAEWLFLNLMEVFPFLPPLLFHRFYSLALLYMQHRELSISSNLSVALFLFFLFKYKSDSAVVLLKLTTASIASTQLVLIFPKSKFQSPSL